MAASFENISNWEKIKRVINLVLKFKKKNTSLTNWCSWCQTKYKGETEELMSIKNLDKDQDQNEIIRLVQGKAFTQKIKLLVSTKIILQSSSIYRLDPYIDDDGWWMAEKSVFDEDTAHPTLLPKKSPISISILRWCHENVSHEVRSFTLNEMHQCGTWMVNANSGNYGKPF